MTPDTAAYFRLRRLTRQIQTVMARHRVFGPPDPGPRA